MNSKKKKVSSYKVTWNANGGKIGSKKTKVTTVKKGSKIGKLVATPKRSGFEFKGWYTKKTGGTKITKNTKPTKSVRYYAKWQKRSINKNIDSKLLKYWKRDSYSYSFDSRTRWSSYTFYANGTFLHWDNVGTSVSKSTGNYKASNGKVYFSNIVHIYTLGGIPQYIPLKDAVSEYKIGKDNRGEYLWIGALSSNPHPDYYISYFSIDETSSYRP